MRFQSTFQTLSGFLPRRTPLLKLNSKISSAFTAGLTLAALLGSESAAKAQGLQFDPTIITYAGTGSLTVTNAGNGGQATAAGLNNPEGIAYDTRGNTYIADYYNNTIRVVNSAGIINAFAGTGTACPNPTAATGACGDGGAASAATFNNPSAMQFDAQGNLYIADLATQRIRKITATNGVITPASIISTVAGTGTAGTTGNTGLATAAQLNYPHGLALDTAGDLWIANQGEGTSCTIGYVPAKAQTITIGGVATALTAGHYYNVAGQIGTCGGAVTGAGTQGTNVQLNSPTNLALDSAGNLYIGDYQNGKVRKLVTTTGVISTIAGTAYQACPVYAPNAAAPNPVPACGDGGLATAATLNGPTGVYVDNANNVVIGDAFGARVREVNGTTGIISTLSGDSQQCTNISQTVTNAAYPTCGDGGAATKALVSFPILISVNPAGNILYVDQYDNKIREIVEHIVFPATNVGVGSTSQNVNLITTGTGNTIINSITVPSDVAGNPEFIVGTVTGCVVGGAGNAPGTVCTIPITFNPAYVGPISAPLVVVTNGGTYHFGLTGTGVAPEAVLLPGKLSTVAGTAGTPGGTGNGNQALAATLNAPRGLTYDSQGNYYIADLGNNEIRKVTAAGVISVFAGGGATNYITNPGGPATAAALNQPTQVAFDDAGNAFISDFGNHVVARVDAVTNAITVYAGTGVAGYSGDGAAATAAQISGPAALAVDQATGDVYIADAGIGATSNQTIRLVNASSGVISTVAGNGTQCATPTAACGDGGQAIAAQLNQPNGLVLDPNGNLYISDSEDNRIRLLTRGTGVISAVAGTGAATYTGDGGAATAATLNSPFQIQLDAAGNLYIADVGNNAIRVVSTVTGKISTVAGNGTACTTVPSPACGDGGTANVSAFSAPAGVALDATGDLFVAEAGSNRVREVTVNPTLLAFPPAPAIGVTEGPLSATLTNIGNATLTYTTPASPNSNALVTTTINPTTGTSTPVTSNAFAQTNATTCGPIYSTSAATTLASGASCNYVVTFTPDTATGNYIGTLVETDNSLYSGNVNPSNTTNPIYPTPLTQTVNLTGSAVKGTATVSSLTSSLNPSYVGQPVTFTATLTGGGIPPTGTVAFSYTPAGSTTPVSIGTGNVSTTAGVTTATVTTSTLPLGTDTVVATYSGDTNYIAGATGTPLAQVVQQVASTSDKLTAASGTIAFGTADQLTFEIPVVAGAAVPTGTVVFAAGTTALGSNTWPASPATGACPSGQAGTCYLLQDSAAPTNIPLGTPTAVTATYTNTNASGYASGTATTNVTVNPASATATLTAIPNTTTYGTPVTLTETIQPISGVCPAGPATFKNNGTTIGTGNISLLNGSCVATLTTANLPVGSDIITATVPASGNFAVTNSGPTTVTIGKAPVTNPTTPVLSQSFTATPSSTPFGSPVTFTYTVPVAVGNAAPTGPVVISSPGFTSVTCTNFTPGTTVAAPVPNPQNLPAYTPYTCTTSSSALPVGSPDTVTATYTTTDPNYAGGAPALTQPVTITAATPVDVLTTSNPTPIVGSAVTFTNTITLINGAVPPSPPVFSYTSGGTTVTLGPGTATATPGVYTLTTTTLPVGSATVVATLPAGGSYASTPSNTVNETIGKVPFNPNTDVLTSSQNPSIFGNPVTFTETIPTVNGLAPSGTVTFYVNGTTQIGTVAVPLSGNVAISVPTSTLATPSDPITAVYSGDTNYQGGTSALTQVVNVATAGATLTAGPNPATFGTPVTIVETLVPINGVCPPGPVTFFDNTGSGPVQIVATGNPATVGANCVASITTSSLPVGANSITATAPASGNFGAVSSGPLPVTINKAAPADLLTSSLNPSTVGQSVTFTDTIPIALAGTPPTGTVQFYDYGVAIGTPQPVNSAGVATIATTTLPPGTDAITAVYSGDGNYAQVTSNQVNQVVNPIATTATLSVGPNPATFGTTVTLQETIPVVNGIAATGTVTFTTPNGTLTAPINASGVASVTTSTLPVGADPITASYPGNTNYTAVSSGPVIETITKANGADVLAVGPNPQVFGSLVTATDTIPTVGGVAPTGTVTFYNNGPTGTNLGTFPVTNGVATLTTTTLPVGSNPITAVYNGDGNYAVVTSNQVNEVITVGNTTPVLGASPNPSTFGTLVTITESIPGINGVTPTGTVTFTYIPAGSTTPVTLSNGTTTAIPLVNGVATVTSTTLPIGVDAVTAVYSGDANYGKATTGPLNVTVNLANPNDTVSANPNPVTFGSPTTLTFTVPLVNGVVPTGTVAFYDGTTQIGTGNVNAQGIATLTTSTLPLGPSTVTAKYPGDNTYASSSPTTQVTVNPVTPISTLTTNPPSTGPAAVCGTAVTLTDTITSVNGATVAGTVQFYNNGVAIGSPVTVAAGGVATLTTTTLACGATNSITAVFTPTAGGPYNPSTAGPAVVPVASPDFTISATPANQVVNPGDSAVYTVSLSGVSVPFTSPVALTATCNCQGVTISFANATVTPGQGPTTTTMTVVTSPTFAMSKPSHGANQIFYGLLLLPLLGLGKVRRKLRTLPKSISYCLAALVLLGGLGAVTGCGGGYYGPQPKTCTITITGTSGTLIHSTTATLTVR